MKPWWFQQFFVFTRILGEVIQFDQYVILKWVETTT